MTIRVIGDFWEIIKGNETLIKSCFFHLLNRYPDVDGYKDSFNNLIMRLYELHVFERFSTEKLILGELIRLCSKEGHEKVEAVRLAKDEMKKKHYTVDNVRGRSINVKKKWEQFIYKWIEKVLFEEYHKDRIYSRRYIHGDNLFDYGMPPEQVCHWIQNEEESQAYNSNDSNFKEDRRGKIYPPSFSNRVKPTGEEFDPAIDVLMADEMQEQIYNRLKEGLERKVFNMLIEGMPEQDIVKALDYTQQRINQVISKIRGITEKLCLV